MDQNTKVKDTPADEARVPAAQLAEFVARAFVAAGLPEADAQAVAGLMVEADLRGSDTHGVIRLPLYVRRLRAGGINAKPNIRVISDRASVALIDGDNGMGHLAMRRAAHLAIEKAKATGVGWVGARMSNHAGPAALYVTMPLAHDMVGLYFAVGSNNHLPDRSKIIIEHGDHIKYWTRHFGVTKDELTRAIERVGNSAAAVRKQLSAVRPPAT
jgi:L-2-hydroxycarboxylate dehydrogenase (NAD+)